MPVACTGLTLDLSNAANGMSRSVRLKCWLQLWTFLYQSYSRGSDRPSGCVQGTPDGGGTRDDKPRQHDVRGPVAMSCRGS